jgi:glutamate racemase
MSDKTLPIGVFDSGIGGLTVLSALRRLLPGEDLIYLGDTARLPYGTKSPASVQRYSMHAAEFLLERGIKFLVVACNTASALALNKLREHLAPLPVVGVVEPGAAAAVAANRSGRHLVLATEATTSHKAYTRAIRELSPDAEVEELACSLFVALAEEGWFNDPAAQVVARQYLGAIRERAAADRPDTAILGCTHFPLVAEAIAGALGDEITIVDSASTTAEVVARTLEERGLANGGSAGTSRFYATDGPERFARIGSAFLGQRFTADDVEIVDIHPTDLVAS